MKGLDRTAIPHDILDRVLDLERRLDDLVGYAAMPVVDPTGEGDTTYVSIVQEVQIGEGPGIDLTGTSPTQMVGLGGDSVLLFDSGGLPVAEFDPTDAGVTAGLAAMAAGDVLMLPDIAITGGPWTVALGVLKGHSRDGSVLDGQVTLTNGTRAETFSIVRVLNTAIAEFGFLFTGEGEVRISNCVIDVTQNGGGLAVGLNNFGSDVDVYLQDCRFYNVDFDVVR